MRVQKWSLIAAGFLVAALAFGLTDTSLEANKGKTKGKGQPSFYQEVPVTREGFSTLATHTVYRPTYLDAEDKLPVVIWENGGCSDNNAGYAYTLTRIAASGFFVVANGPASIPPTTRPVNSPLLWPDPAPPVPPPANAPTIPNPEPREIQLDADVALMRSALDWAVAENSRVGSPFYNRLDLTKVAAAGYSCGGFVAMAAAIEDSRFRSVLGYNTSSWPDADVNYPRRQALLQLDVPTAWIDGGPGDIATPGLIADWSLPLTAPIFQAQHTYAGHGGFWGSQSFQLEVAEIGIYWLDFTLSGKGQARQYILQCGFCDNPYWETEARNWTGPIPRKP